MLELYGVALVRERSRLDDSSELGRYLRWEYGSGTHIGALDFRAPARGSRRRGVSLLDRLTGLMHRSRGRAGPRPGRGVEREITLLAQWKQGRIRTVELVSLEDFRRTEPVEETWLSP